MMIAVYVLILVAQALAVSDAPVKDNEENMLGFTTLSKEKSHEIFQPNAVPKIVSRLHYTHGNSKRKREWKPHSLSQTINLSSDNEANISDRRSGVQGQNINLKAATKRQIEYMCEEAGCRPFQGALYLGDFFKSLPKMLDYLKKNAVYIYSFVFGFWNPGDFPEQKVIRIQEKGENEFEVVSSNNRKFTLTQEYRRYMTENIEVFVYRGSWLEYVASQFFEKFFPKLERIDIKGKPTAAMKELSFGFLPKLTRVYLEYPVAGNISGCVLPVSKTMCFPSLAYLYIGLENERVTVPSFQLSNFSMPTQLQMFSINLDKAVVKPTDVLNGKIIKRLYLQMYSVKQIEGFSFEGTVVNDLTIKGGQPQDVPNLTSTMKGILNNERTFKKIAWDWQHGNTLAVPVVYYTRGKNELQDVHVHDIIQTTCRFSYQITDRSNENTTTSTKKPFYRALYIDLTLLIDKLEKEKRQVEVLEVTAFHLHVSASRNVTYKLIVSFMKITTEKNATICNIFGNGNNILKSTGAAIKDRETVDAIFVQALQVCTASIMSQEQSLGRIDNTDSSEGLHMWSYPLPAIMTGTDDDISRAQRLRVKIGEFVEYVREASLQRAMKVPYLSLQYQQENMGILLRIAESTLKEKRAHKLMSKLQDIKKEILDKQDKSTRSLLQTEYKRTVSLVLISTRRAHDINKKLKATINLVKKVNATYIKYKAEMEKQNETFMAGVQRAKIMAGAEVATAIASTVISFFSGGFDPGKIAKAAAKLKKLLSLTKIFKKLAKLIKTLIDIQKLSKKSTAAITGRIGRLFQGILTFHQKRGTHLKNLMEKYKVFPEKLIIQKKFFENQKRIDKYTRVFKKIRNGRESASYMNNVITTIIAAEKAKVKLNNAFKEGSVQDIQNKKPSNDPKTDEDLKDALVNEYAVAAGDRKEQKEAFAKILEDYKLTGSKDVVEEGQKLDAADVMAWEAANKNIEGSMDASISADIPETTGFKAALMKMNVAGKMKTQAMIDESALRVDLDRARFETTTYFKEGAAILKKIEKIEREIKKRKSGNVDQDLQSHYKKRQKEAYLQISWKEFNVKLNILVASLSYCSAYYYFHLSPCPPEHVFEFDTNLDEVINQQRELQRQSLLQLEDFYPPPQTMQNRSLSFNEPNATCNCLIEKIKTKNDEKLHQVWNSECPPFKKNPLDLTKKEVNQNLQHLYKDCLQNEVLEMKEFSRTTIEVSVNDALSIDHSRVRIDEVQVILHGAKTDSGVISISIETSGLSQDRYKGELFNFYGDKWRRDFAYYSPQSRNDPVAANSNPDGKSAKPEVQEIHILDAANVHRNFRGVYRTSTFFTSWVITVDPRRNKGLNLSGLHKIDLKFSGSFVATDDYGSDEKNARDSSDAVEREMSFDDDEEHEDSGFLEEWNSSI